MSMHKNYEEVVKHSPMENWLLFRNFLFILLLSETCFSVSETRNLSAYGSIADFVVTLPENLKGKTLFDVVNDVSLRVLPADIKLSWKQKNRLLCDAYVRFPVLGANYRYCMYSLSRGQSAVSF